MLLIRSVHFDTQNFLDLTPFFYNSAGTEQVVLKFGTLKDRPDTKTDANMGRTKTINRREQ